MPEPGLGGAEAPPLDPLTPRAARLRLLALAATVGALLAAVTLSGGLSSARVHDWIEPLGPFGPLAFVPVSATLTVVLFPGPLLAGASGLLFGPALGFPVTLTAAVLGASAAFTISRRFGARSVERLAGPRLQRLQGWIERRGFLAVLYARIAPGVPYNLVNYAAGLTRVRLRTFAAATALGASPRAFAYTALGGSLDDLTSPEALVAFAVLALMAVGGAAVALRERRRSAQDDRVVLRRDSHGSQAGRGVVDQPQR